MNVGNGSCKKGPIKGPDEPLVPPKSLWTGTSLPRVISGLRLHQAQHGPLGIVNHGRILPDHSTSSEPAVVRHDLPV